MKRILVLLAVVAAFVVSGVGNAFAASTPQSSVSNANCPYAKDGAPIRARDGSGQKANRATAKANATKNGAKQRVRARDGSGRNARTDVQRGDCDGTGPHGPYRGGR